MDPVERAQQADFLARFTRVAGVLAGVLSAGYFTTLRLPLIGAALVALGGALWLTPRLARRTSLVTAWHGAATLVTLAVVLICLQRGDFPLGALLSLTVLPVASGYLVGPRGATAWAAVGVLVVAWAWLRVQLGVAHYAPPLLEPEVIAQRDLFEAVSLVNVLVLLTVTALDIERRRRLASTERQRLRDALEQRRAAARLGRLAAGVAHEINNPVAWMQSGTSWLRAHLPGDGEPQEVVGELKEGLTRVTRIVTHLQAVARPGEVTDAASVSRVLDIVETLGRCDEQQRKRTLHVVRDVQADQVRASEGLLAQVLLDLVLESEHLEVTLKSERVGDEVTVTVSPAAPHELELLTALVQPWGARVSAVDAVVRVHLRATA